MSVAVFALSVALLLPAELPAKSEPPRKPNPFAPSLPLLTDEEETRLDELIDRYIQFDLGHLRGEEGKRALVDFQRLGPEAIPALIRGMNRAAHIEGSCPAVVIAKKLTRLLNASNDPELLEFARENIGAGVTQSRHMGVIKDLRFTCMMRKRAIGQKTVVQRSDPAKKSMRTMALPELVQIAGSERGSRLQLALTELAERNGDQVLNALAAAAASYDKEIQQLARDLLHGYLSRQSAGALKETLKDERAEVRAATARVIASKGLKLTRELIALLADEDAGVRQAARQALVRLSGGTDFGPERDASEADRLAAVRKWRDWSARQ